MDHRHASIKSLSRWLDSSPRYPVLSRRILVPERYIHPYLSKANFASTSIFSAPVGSFPACTNKRDDVHHASC